MYDSESGWLGEGGFMSKAETLGVWRIVQGIVVGAERSSEGLFGATHSRFDGADGDALDLGNVLVRHAFDFCEDEGPLLIGRQLGERAVDGSQRFRSCGMGHGAFVLGA